jgi:hypothetical protein
LGQQEIQTYLEDFYAQLDVAERLADLAFSLTFPVKSELAANLRTGEAISTNLAREPEYQWEFCGDVPDNLPSELLPLEPKQLSILWVV